MSGNEPIVIGSIALIEESDTAIYESGVHSVRTYLEVCKKVGIEPSFEDFVEKTSHTAQQAYYEVFEMQVSDVAVASVAAGYAYAVWEAQQKKGAKP